MKKLLLTAVLTLGLATSANAEVEKMPLVTDGGGFGDLKFSSQFVAVAAVGLMAVYAIQQNAYNCKIVKTGPKPGTNYTNEKSVCTKS